MYDSAPGRVVVKHGMCGCAFVMLTTSDSQFVLIRRFRLGAQTGTTSEARLPVGRGVGWCCVFKCLMVLRPIWVVGGSIPPRHELVMSCVPPGDADDHSVAISLR